MPPSDHPPEPEAASPPTRRSADEGHVSGSGHSHNRPGDLVPGENRPPVTTAVEGRTVEPLIAATAPEPGGVRTCLEWEPGDLGCRTWVIVTTTTLPPVESARGNLNIALPGIGDERSTLTALAAAYEAMARALDDNDQAAIIALLTAQRSDNQDLVYHATEAVADTLDPLDVVTLQVGIDAHRRLEDRLNASDWGAIDRYLSFVEIQPSDFDRFLDMGFRLNMAEVDALREALN